jgi:hypothetical protein
MYLRDTAIIKHQHVADLCSASREAMDLISALPKDVLALSTTMIEVNNDPQMQEYADKED